MNGPFPYPTQTIPDLPPAVTLDGSEEIWINQAALDARTTLGDIAALVTNVPPSLLAPVGPTPPASPQAGAFWFDSVSTQLFLWYVDATSQQWVVANNTGVGLPEAPTDGATYARQGSTASWQPVMTSASIHPLTVDAGVF